MDPAPAGGRGAGGGAAASRAITLSVQRGHVLAWCVARVCRQPHTLTRGSLPSSHARALSVSASASLSHTRMYTPQQPQRRPCLSTALIDTLAIKGNLANLLCSMGERAEAPP